MSRGLGLTLRTGATLTLLACCAAPPAHAPAAPVIAWHGSGSLLAGHIGGRHVVLVADEAHDRVRRIDLDGGPIVDQPLPGGPSAIAASGGDVFVALRRTSEVIHLASGARVRVPAEPVALASDAGDVYVVSAWEASFSALRRGALAWTVPLARDPRAVVIVGRRAFVSHGTAARVSVIDLDAAVAAVHEIPLEGLERTTRGPSVRTRAVEAHDPMRRQAGQGFAIAEGGGRVFLPLVMVDPGDEARRSSGYGPFTPLGSETPAAAVLDPNGALLAASLDVREALHPAFSSNSGPPPCLLPRAAAVRANGGLLVACDGLDALLELDDGSIEPFTAERRRVTLPAGPRAMVIDDGKAIVQSEHAVAVVDEELHVRVVARDGEVESEGRRLFHAPIAEDGRSCASCHPGGRDDGFTWFTPDGPRQTPSLAGRLDRQRFGWGGESATIEQHLDRTLHRLHARALEPRETASLVTYVRSLDPWSAPAAAAGALGERGRAVFASAEAGCAGCHGGDALTDERVHDVGSATRADVASTFRTPSLVRVAGTAPYFHDGRYATLHDLLVRHDTTMGHTEHLGAADLAALEAFLRSR